MLVNLDIDPNEMITVPTDIWTKRFKLSVCVCFFWLCVCGGACMCVCVSVLCACSFHGYELASEEYEF